MGKENLWSELTVDRGQEDIVIEVIKDIIDGPEEPRVKLNSIVGLLTINHEEETVEWDKEQFLDRYTEGLLDEGGNPVTKPALGHEKELVKMGPPGDLPLPIFQPIAEARESRKNSLKKLSSIAQKSKIRPRARKRLVAALLDNI